jgi:hypothetical protein
MNCKNCQNILSTETKYCPSCGQSNSDFNRPFFSIVLDALNELLDIDGRLLITLKTLLAQPGLLSLEFIRGKRVTYTPPLRLYLVISITFFVLFSLTNPYISESPDNTGSMSDYYAKAMFVLFPLFALLVQVFYQKSSYMGNLVFSLHIHSFAYFVLIVIATLEAFEEHHIILLLLQIPPTLYLLWYILKAFKTVYEQSWLMTIIKASSIYLIYMGLLGVAFDVVLTHLI